MQQYSKEPISIMSKTDQSLSDVFGTELMIAKEPLIPEIVMEDHEDCDEEIERDIKTARNNILNILQTGNTALDFSLELLKVTESPKTVEALSGMMKNLADINSQLLDIHQKKRILRQKSQNKITETPNVVTNNSIVFQGTTADFQKMLNQMKEEKD